METRETVLKDVKGYDELERMLEEEMAAQAMTPTKLKDQMRTLARDLKGQGS